MADTYNTPTARLAQIHAAIAEARDDIGSWWVDQDAYYSQGHPDDGHHFGPDADETARDYQDLQALLAAWRRGGDR
jgi:hypothetical protein